jgi:uncharacterized membrane protein YgcG
MADDSIGQFCVIMTFMNSNNDLTPDEPTPSNELPVAEAAPVAVANTPPVHQAPPMPDPRRRLRELLSIPESQRTDPQWDEIIELEVQLAPGNRIGAEMPRSAGGGGGQNRSHGGGNPGGQKGGGGGAGGGGGGGGNNFKRHAGRKFPKAKKPAGPA